jgi:hypothetical protein
LFENSRRAWLHGIQEDLHESRGGFEDRVGAGGIALVYPMLMFMKQDPALSMMLSVYVTLGVFLLLAIRNPGANRSLIAFTAWSSFAHAVVMGTQAMRNMIAHGATDRRGCSCGDWRSLDRPRTVSSGDSRASHSLKANVEPLSRQRGSSFARMSHSCRDEAAL